MQVPKGVQPSYVKTAAVYGRNAWAWHAQLHEALGHLAVPYKIFARGGKCNKNWRI